MRRNDVVLLSVSLAHKWVNEYSAAAEFSILWDIYIKLFPHD
jgi:hypothetical protein